MSILYDPPYKNRKWDGKKSVLDDGTIVYKSNGKLHRRIGAAVIRSEKVSLKNLQAAREYRQQDELHRKDGPARIWEEGWITPPDTRLFLELPENTYLNDTPILLSHLREEWFLFGQRHRKEGPAIVAKGEVQYWHEGKLHREDGPAIIRDPALSYLKPRHFKLEGECLSLQEYWHKGKLQKRTLTNGTVEWFKNGLHHRESAPAIERDSRYVKSQKALALEENAFFEYRQYGQLHREDGPAIMRWDPEQECFHYQWFIRGNLENQYGPAEMWLNGNKLYKKDGQLHREDGPAVIFAKERRLEWHQNGKKTRQNGPAVTEPEKHEYWYEGKLHRNDGPAIHSKEKEIYYRKGLRHRLDGPALIVYGKYHEWYQDNLLHRIKAPAVWREISFAIEKDLPAEEYYQEGKLHKTQGAAQVYPDGTKKYFQDNQLHRKDGPAIERSRKRALREKAPLLEYYQRGKLHRVDGPARIWPGGKKEYWLEGLRHQKDQVSVTQYSVLG